MPGPLTREQELRHDLTKAKAATKAVLKQALAKTETVTFRLSVTDKKSMQSVAKQYRMTVSEYLVNLHHFAMKLLDTKKRKEATPETDPES